MSSHNITFSWRNKKNIFLIQLWVDIYIGLHGINVFYMADINVPSVIYVYVFQLIVYEIRPTLKKQLHVFISYKLLFFPQKQSIDMFHENICCGYSLEVTH